MPDLEYKGHRQRLRERFIKGDTSSHSEAALLELLLTYAIPQRDVQPLAKRLLAEYGSLSSLLTAPMKRLCQSQEIKETSAVLLKLVDHIRREFKSVEQIIQKEIEPPVQTTLFDSVSPVEIVPEKTVVKDKSVEISGKEKSSTRRGTELFGKAVLKETIQILPKLPFTNSMKEITDFLNKNLPFNSVQTRTRRGRYIKFNMFADNALVLPLIKFAHAFPESRELKDVCFYKFCKAQPLMLDFIESIMLPRIGAGSINRDAISEYLRSRYPESKAINDATSAVCEALFGAEIASKKGNQIAFSLRAVPVTSFVFVLHSEFPEPGMYDIEKLITNRVIKAMLWNPEQILNSLYEVRNQGLISKISEIDNIRQFTTKYALVEVVEKLSSKGEKV
ncbi:MAG: DNA repair protein [Dehalococcoides mccartyi]|uniref:UPF0758 domain-containing protein n=1 Tax=Dehalococcoides TaxID=61434 RepID=UPI002738030B|nr:UPF0758 domain-containing protein [Dehalococcoides mccartyi]MDP4280444.1 DNA repair protein [Dehalococcoides mccartyi]